MSVELIFRIATIGILTAVINLLLTKAGKDDMAMLTSLAGVVIVMAMILDVVFDLFSTMKSLFTLF